MPVWGCTASTSSRGSSTSYAGRRSSNRCAAGSARNWQETSSKIGFGSGLNVPFYPHAVSRVSAVEPADVSWKLADRRLRSSGVPVERAGLDGQSLPFADDSYDAALTTWTLCTIPDVAGALREVRRVLRPGATLHSLEHGLAPTSRFGAGNAASSRCRSGPSANATSRGPSSTC